MGKCSLCQTEGHNKRTCPSLKTTDKDAVTVEKHAEDAPAAVVEKPKKVKKTNKFIIKFTDTESGDKPTEFGYSDLANAKKGISALKNRINKKSKDALEEILAAMKADEEIPQTFEDLVDALDADEDPISIGKHQFKLVTAE
jgi:rubrerythrin